MTEPETSSEDHGRWLDAFLAEQERKAALELGLLGLKVRDRRALAAVLSGTGVAPVEELDVSSDAVTATVEDAGPPRVAALSSKLGPAEFATTPQRGFVCPVLKVPPGLARVAIADEAELADMNYGECVADEFAEIRVRTLVEVARDPTVGVAPQPRGASAAAAAEVAAAAVLRTEELLAAARTEIPIQQQESAERLARFDDDIARAERAAAEAAFDRDKKICYLDAQLADELAEKMRNFRLDVEELRMHVGAGKPVFHLTSRRWPRPREEIVAYMERYEKSDVNRNMSADDPRTRSQAIRYKTGLESIRKSLETALPLEQIIASEEKRVRDLHDATVEEKRHSIQAPAKIASAEVGRLMRARARAAAEIERAAAKSQARVSELEAELEQRRAQAAAAAEEATADAATAAALRAVAADCAGPPDQHLVYRIRNAAARMSAAIGARALLRAAVSHAGLRDFVEARRWAVRRGCSDASADLFVENCHAWVAAWDAWSRFFGEDPDRLVHAAAALPAFRASAPSSGASARR